MSDSVEFEKDEKVLCFHGPMLYEAKILKLELWTNRPDLLEGTFYFVHYRGWKQSWDEWVPNTRLRKLNAVNLALQQELRNTVVPTKEKPLKIEKRPELVIYNFNIGIYCLLI
jgi:mortality factor 4-like protein 1